MNTRSNASAPRRGVPPVVVAIAALLLLAFVAWRGWVAFGPVRGAPLPPPPTADINFIKQKAQESQGDFKRLSPEDQSKVQQISHGFGPSAIASTYRRLQAHPDQQ